MKRALWGELQRRIFGSWTASYFFLAGIGLAVCAALATLLWRACRRLPLSSDTIRFLVVFAASPALAFLAHLAGYLEQVGYLALMAALLFRRLLAPAARVAAGRPPPCCRSFTKRRSSGSHL
jgi:hypothetical protein